jgi:hypothetical protein
VTATIAGGPTTKLVASSTWMQSERLGSQSVTAQGWTTLDTLANEISSRRACHVGL